MNGCLISWDCSSITGVEVRFNTRPLRNQFPAGFINNDLLESYIKWTSKVTQNNNISVFFMQLNSTIIMQYLHHFFLILVLLNHMSKDKISLAVSLRLFWWFWPKRGKQTSRHATDLIYADLDFLISLFFGGISTEVPSIDSDKYIDKIGSVMISKTSHSSTIHLKERKSYMMVI